MGNKLLVFGSDFDEKETLNATDAIAQKKRFIHRMLLFPTNGKGKQTYYRYYYYYSSSPFLPLPSLIIRHVKKREKMGGGRERKRERERERKKSLLFPGWMGRPQWIIPRVGFDNY